MSEYHEVDYNWRKSTWIVLDDRHRLVGEFATEAEAIQFARYPLPYEEAVKRLLDDGGR